MADELSVTIEPQSGELELIPGEVQTLLAKASHEGAVFAWTKNAAQSMSGPSIEVEGSKASVGHYEVTATIGTGATSTTATASVHVKLAPEGKPALWHPTFARWSAGVTAAMVIFLSLPAYVIAWRAAFGKDTGAQVVAMFLVLPGLLALGAGIFVLLLDYRGRLAKPSQSGQAGRAALGADGLAKVLQGVAVVMNTMNKATRGAVALVLASVAIFGFAAWAAVGGDGASDPADGTTPTPTSSVTPSGSSPSPSPSRTTR